MNANEQQAPNQKDLLKVLELKQVAFVPVMTKERFSDLTGVAPGVLKAWVERDYVPSIPFGKHRLVNVAMLQKQCLGEV